MRLLPLMCLLCCLLACSPPVPPPGTSARPVEGKPQETATRAPQAAVGGASATPRPLAGGLKTELVADGVQLPANLVFAPDGRLFFTEVSEGRVRIIEHGQLQPDSFAEVEAPARPQMGLLGLALDPDFGRNRFVYLFYSQSKEEKAWRNRVVRFTDESGRGTNMQVILDDLPTGIMADDGSHNGGRLGFGPDGKLYVTIGDTGARGSVQKKDALQGKVLRINPDGSIPPDNPAPDSRMYALGFRNPWGLAFHPISGAPYVTDNGPEGHDEINRVQASGNYGWPERFGIQKLPRFVDPIWESKEERGGVTGLAFYTGNLFPEYHNDLLFCAFVNGRLLRLRLGGPDYTRVEQEEALSDQCYLDVATGPEGAIYMASINRILRLVPNR